jgi:FAD:protein FMN transferase
MDPFLQRVAPSPDSGLTLERSRGGTKVHRLSHAAMATVFEVFLAHPDERYAAQGAQAAFDLVDRLERELSRFLPNSDITRINHLEPGDRTRVAASTMECLGIARHMFDLTDGAFDVSIGTGLASLALDPDESTVQATRSGVHLDLGGVGKGYAVDLMAELLDEWDLGRALVHGGFSSVLALDASDEDGGWALSFSDPRQPSRVLERVSLRQTAVGASGIRKTDHVVDPRSGVPIRERLASWATVPRPVGDDGRVGRAAAVTDALTTAFLVLSAEQVEALCEQSPGLSAWLLEPPARPGDDSRLIRFGSRRE